MKTALLVVDVQNDFCTGGTLPVPHAEEILPTVNACIAEHRHVFFAQDWHPPGHVSFASSHPGRAVFSRIKLADGEQELWPDHCIAGTHGAEFHPDLDRSPDAVVVRKGTHRGIDSYSGFFENDQRTPTGLDARLRDVGIRRLLLCGLATDFCVFYTALDARRLGYEVAVIAAGCRGIDIDGSVARAWDAMTAAGVRRT